MFKLRTLGGLDLRDPTGEELTQVLVQPKLVGLLTYLAGSTTSRFHRRDSLLAVFWPDLDTSHARNSLRQTLFALRHALGDGLVQRRGDQEIGLDPAKLGYDVWEFQHALKTGRHDDAVTHYRGEFLSGFFLQGVPSFDDWVDSERGRLARQFADVLEHHADALEKNGDVAGAIEQWYRLAEQEPFNSRVVLGLMRALDRAGDTGRAVEQAERHAALLREELGADPDPEVLRLAQQLRTRGADSSVASTDVISAASPTDHSPGVPASSSFPALVAALLGVASLAVLAIAYTLMVVLGLPSWVFAGTAALLLIGLPIMLVTAFVERGRAVANDVVPARGIRRWFTWRKAIGAGVLAFAGLSVMTVAFTAMRSLGVGPAATLVTSGALETGDLLVLAEFENRTGDSLIGRTTTELFRIALSESPTIRLLAPNDQRAALERMQRDPTAPLDQQLAREVAIRKGAPVFMRGSIAAAGNGYVITAGLIDPQSGAVLAAHAEQVHEESELVSSVDRVARRLRERIGESLKSIRRTPPLATVTTPSLEALQLYTRGFQAESNRDQENALAFYEEAVRVDSLFVSAYYKIAVILNNSGRSPDRARRLTIKQYKLRDRLSTEERYGVEYLHHLWFTGYDSALAGLESWRRRFPHGTRWLNNLGSMYRRTRRFEEAAALYRESIARVGSPASHGNLGLTLWALGDTVGAAKVLAYFGERHTLLADLLVLTGDYAGAERMLQEMRGVREPSAGYLWRVSRRLANLYRLRGRIREAELVLQEAARYAAQSHRRRDVMESVLASAEIALRFRADTSLALRRIDSVLSSGYLDSTPPLDRLYLELVEFFSEAGDPVTAADYLVRYETLVSEMPRPRSPFYKVSAASIAEAEGRPTERIRALHQAYDDYWGDLQVFGRLARAFDRMGQADSALHYYTLFVDTPRWTDRLTLELPHALLRLGQLNDAHGRVTRAVTYYRRFVDLWEDADPELQQTVAEVQARIAELIGVPQENR